MGEYFGGYFNFSKCFIHESKTHRARPPTRGSHASARQPFAPSASVNELRSPDAPGPEAGKPRGEPGLAPGKAHESASRAPRGREGAVTAVTRLHALTLNMLLAKVAPAG